MLHRNLAFICSRYGAPTRTPKEYPMSKQLTLSATFCVFAMALFAIAGDKAPPSASDMRGSAPFALKVGIAR
jgi:hypothetical protein